MSSTVEDLGPDYELVWPRQLFAEEAAALLRASPTTGWVGQAELLLEEAFVGDAPAHDLRDGSMQDLLGLDLSAGWGAPADSEARGSLQRLVEVADELPEQAAPRPYWSQRHTPSREAGPFEPAQLFRDWVDLVNVLRERGYLDRFAGRRCVDDHDEMPDPDEVLNGKTVDLLGLHGVWPLRRDDWDGDVDRLYGLIEVVHDLVARPRSRWLHDYAQCGWHYAAFAPTPGRALYRWSTDQLLKRNRADVRFAGSGEDAGRLVRVTGDDRDVLFTRALDSTPKQDGGEVEHAIALFRARGATREDRRSAIVSLARVLESRRTLLKRELLSQDERALFELANRYDLRHNRADQRPDYDDAFLEWIFWWYLATVELTNQVIAQQHAQA